MLRKLLLLESPLVFFSTFATKVLSFHLLLRRHLALRHLLKALLLLVEFLALRKLLKLILRHLSGHLALREKSAILLIRGGLLKLLLWLLHLLLSVVLLITISAPESSTVASIFAATLSTFTSRATSWYESGS